MKEVNKLAIIGAFRALGGSLIWPFTGYALYSVFNFSLTQVSLYYLVQGVISVIAYIVGGYLTDFIGRTKTLIISILSSSLFLFLSSIFYLPYYVATFLLLQSFFNNVYNVANTTLVGDINSRQFKKLVSSFSRVRVGINAGWAFGPLVGSIIFQQEGFRNLLFYSSLILLIPLVLIKGLSDMKGKRSVKFSLEKSFLIFIIPTFFTFMIMGQLGFSLLTYYTTVSKFTIEDVGFLFMVNGLMIVFLQDLISKALKPIHIILGMLIYSISYFSVSFVTNFFFAIVNMVFITTAEMIVSPLSQALVSYLTKDEERGKEIGVYGMVTALGRLMGSSYASYLMSFYLYYPVKLWLLITLPGFLSIPLYLLSLRRINTNG